MSCNHGRPQNILHGEEGEGQALGSIEEPKILSEVREVEGGSNVVPPHYGGTELRPRKKTLNSVYFGAC